MKQNIPEGEIFTVHVVSALEMLFFNILKLLTFFC